MTNFEHYKDFFIKILKEEGRTNIGLVKGEPKQCAGISCNQCDFHGKIGSCSSKLTNWFKEEYKEPGIDWTKVPVDACSNASRFVELPCKVGDTVYAISTEEPSLISFGKIVDGKLNSFHITEHRTLASGVGFYRNISEFGKTVFLTREEAEKSGESRRNARTYYGGK